MIGWDWHSNNSRMNLEQCCWLQTRNLSNDWTTPNSRPYNEQDTARVVSSSLFAVSNVTLKYGCCLAFILTASFNPYCAWSSKHLNSYGRYIWMKSRNHTMNSYRLKRWRRKHMPTLEHLHFGFHSMFHQNAHETEKHIMGTPSSWSATLSGLNL